MKIRLAAPLQYDSVVDGEGIRTVIWTQGCSHNCKGCHNPETHDFNGGALIDIEDIKKELMNLKFQDGITLSGGDPFMQPDACLEIARFAKKIGLNVWIYTGFTFDQLKTLGRTKPVIIELLKNTDVLIDGKFVLEEKTYEAPYRGSKNQRIIDVQQSLIKNEIVIVDKYNEQEVKRGKYLFV